MKPKRSKISITYNNMNIKEKELDISDYMEHSVSSDIEKQEICDVSVPMAEDDDIIEELLQLDNEKTETVEPSIVVTNQITMGEVKKTESVELMDNPEAILFLDTIQTEYQGIELMKNSESKIQSENEYSDTDNKIIDVAIKQELINNDIESINIGDNSEDEQSIFESSKDNDSMESIYDGEDITSKNENINQLEVILDQQTLKCHYPTENCSECSAIFNDVRREVFGYQAQTAICECHDICVEDVRDICVKDRILRKVIPCTVADNAGCRGGFLPDEPPEIHSVRVLCAEERLSPTTGCDRIINKVEFEVVFQFDNTIVVETPRDEFTCMFYEFARFPSGVFYSNDLAGVGLNQFRKELGQIDGSCKVIIIEDVSTDAEGNDCYVVIKYKVIDKLWKHENLLVSAIKPYSLPWPNYNFTVKQEFEQGHKLGVCPGEN